MQLKSDFIPVLLPVSPQELQHQEQQPLPPQQLSGRYKKAVSQFCKIFEELFNLVICQIGVLVLIECLVCIFLRFKLAILIVVLVVSLI